MFEKALANGVQIGTDTGLERFLLMAAVFVGVVVWVVLITQGQRRIPIQSAKHVRGRKQVGGQRQFLPLRINQAGVMPIIFASSLLMFPYFIFNWLAQWAGTNHTLNLLSSAFGGGRGFVYSMCYVGLIYFFCYFWTAITFNPKEIANNLKDHGSFIPGYRPGVRTANYLEGVMVRITYVGAAFLSLIAIIPTLIASSLGIPPLVASFYGGTGLLIVVSVALDLVQKIDSHLITRNYPGLLDSEQKS
jgi:preprotein translocase subunit SecY